MLHLYRAYSLRKIFLPFSSPFNCNNFNRSSFSSRRMQGYRTPEAQSSKRGSPHGRGSGSTHNSSMYGERSGSHNVGPRNKSPLTIGPQLRKGSQDRLIDSSRGSGGETKRNEFDICKTPSVCGAQLRPSLFEMNRAKRKEAQCFKNIPQHEYLRPGMILLKKYIDQNDQIRIVRKCRELGNAVGGFYRPGYEDGAKLRLQMMCLGKNWDPESRKYEDRRPFDGATPPEIPEEFRKLVDAAINFSHDLIKREYNCIIVEEELPWMSPDLCIVNFYGSDGRLGLHQDRDESEESLQKGLPVVSFSIGDSAEFLYGDGRDEDKAQKVLLESGDVLIFGGKSRPIFHGVSRINQKTAPKLLIDKTNLRPGRLNLTFRKY